MICAIKGRRRLTQARTWTRSDGCGCARPRRRRAGSPGLRGHGSRPAGARRPAALVVGEVTAPPARCTPSWFTSPSLTMARISPTRTGLFDYPACRAAPVRLRRAPASTAVPSARGRDRGRHAWCAEPCLIRRFSGSQQFHKSIFEVLDRADLPALPSRRGTPPPGDEDWLMPPAGQTDERSLGIERPKLAPACSQRIVPSLGGEEHMPGSTATRHDDASLPAPMSGVVATLRDGGHIHACAIGACWAYVRRLRRRARRFARRRLRGRPSCATREGYGSPRRRVAGSEGAAVLHESAATRSGSYSRASHTGTTACKGRGTLTWNSPGQRGH